MPYFLQLLVFFKTRCWKGLLQKKPVLLVADKCIAVLLVLLCGVQLVYGHTWVQAGAAAFNNISLGRALLLALLINVCGLLYFPGACAKSIGRGLYHVYPVSAYELNGMRIIEGLFAKTFLASINLLIIPVFLACPPGAVFLAAVPATVFLLRIMSVLLYDLLVYAAKAPYGLALLLLVSAAGYIMLMAKPGNTWPVWLLKETRFSFSAAKLGGLLLATAVLFMVDTRLLARNTVNKLKHG